MDLAKRIVFGCTLTDQPLLQVGQLLAQLCRLLRSLLSIGDRGIARCPGFVAFPLDRAQFGFHCLTLFGKGQFPLFYGDDPQRAHGVGHRRWQIGAERVDLRSLVFPQLQLIIDGGSAALLDDGIDLVDGDFVRSLCAGNELGGGFTGALAGIADTAHGQFQLLGGSILKNVILYITVLRYKYND